MLRFFSEKPSAPTASRILLITSLAVYNSQENYYRILDTYITDRIRGVFVTDASVYHVSNYLVERGLKERIGLIGCDLTEDDSGLTFERTLISGDLVIIQITD